MRRPFARRRLSTHRELKDNRGGRRLLRPSTHTQAKYHQPHRSETHRHAGPCNPVEGIGRRPPEESAGGVHRTYDGESDAAGGRLNDMDREEAKGKEREETGKVQGTGNLGESWRGGEREEGGPEPSSDGGKLAN